MKKLSEKLKQIKSNIPVSMEYYVHEQDIDEAIKQAEQYEAMRSPEEVRDELRLMENERDNLPALNSYSRYLDGRIESYKRVLKQQ